MEFEKIFTSFNEEHRRVTLSIVICTFILHSVFYASSDLYRNLEWYSQLLFSLGVSASYIGTIVFIFFWMIKLVYLSYLSIPLLSFPAMIEFILSTRLGAFDFNRFLSGFGCCFIVQFIFFISLQFKEKKETRRKAVKKERNKDV